MSTRDLLQVVFRRKAIILSLFFSITATAAVGSFLQPPVYRSSSRLLVQRDEGRLILVAPGLSVRQDTQIQSEAEIIKSRPVAEAVVADLNLGRLWAQEEGLGNPHNYDGAIGRLQGGMEVEVVEDTKVIEVSYEVGDPNLAARIVDSVVKNYLAYRLKFYGDTEKYSFFDKQLEIVRGNLNGLEESLGDFKSKEALVSPQQHEGILLARLADFEGALSDVQTKIIRKEAELEAIREQVAKGYRTIIPPSGGADKWEFISVLRNKLLGLELERNELLQKYTPEHRLVANVEEEIRLTTEKLKREVDQIISLEESSLKALKNEERVLQSRIDRIAEEIRKLSRDESQITKLSRGIEDNVEIYSMLLKKREETRMERQGKVDIPEIKVLNSASVPSEPIKPRKKRNIAFAFVLSLAVGFGVALFLEYLDHSLKTPEDVEYYLGLPVLASIPDVRK